MSTELGPFGNWLKDVMDRRGWNNKDLAAAVGANAGTVSRWRNNVRLPDPQSCEKIAEALGVDADIVLVRAGHRKPRRPIEEYDIAEDLLEAKRQMDDATQAFQTVTVERKILWGTTLSRQGQTASTTATRGKPRTMADVLREQNATTRHYFDQQGITAEEYERVLKALEHIPAEGM